MTLLVAPKPAIMQKVQQARALAAKALRKERDRTVPDLSEGPTPEQEQLRRDAEIRKLEAQLKERDARAGIKDDDDDEAEEPARTEEPAT